MQAKDIAQYEHQIACLLKENEELRRIADDAEGYMRENRILHSENQIALRIQNSMMPKKGVLDKKEHCLIYGDIDFAKEVGGDYYDYFRIDDDRICLSIGDVSGKGVPAVIYMVAAKLLIKNELQHNSTLTDAYRRANLELYNLAGERQFVTGFSVILNTHTGELEYVNAGHVPALFIHKDGTAEFLDKLSGLPLGSYYSAKKPELSKYESYNVTLSEGDIIVLYTDGCIEASNDKGEMLGLEHFKELFLKCQDMDDITDRIRYVQRQIISFENHEEQDDDYTIAAIAWF